MLHNYVRYVVPVLRAVLLLAVVVAAHWVWEGEEEVVAVQLQCKTYSYKS